MEHKECLTIDTPILSSHAHPTQDIKWSLPLFHEAVDDLLNVFHALAIPDGVGLREEGILPPAREPPDVAKDSQVALADDHDALGFAPPVVVLVKGQVLAGRVGGRAVAHCGIEALTVCSITRTPPE